MTDDRIKAAMEAHTHMNVFECVVALLESGCIYGRDTASANRTALQIIKMCKAEQQRQLRIMDRATGRNA